MQNKKLHIEMQKNVHVYGQTTKNYAINKYRQNKTYLPDALRAR